MDSPFACSDVPAQRHLHITSAASPTSALELRRSPRLHRARPLVTSLYPRATMAQSAVDLKNEGNKAFQAGDYPGAVELYSKAIELNDTEPLFFTNRAQVRTLSSVNRCRVTDSAKGIHQDRSIRLCHRGCYQGNRTESQAGQGTLPRRTYVTLTRMLILPLGLLPKRTCANSHPTTERSNQRFQRMRQARPEQQGC